MLSKKTDYQPTNDEHLALQIYQRGKLTGENCGNDSSNEANYNYSHTLMVNEHLPLQTYQRGNITDENKTIPFVATQANGENYRLNEANYNYAHRIMADENHALQLYQRGKITSANKTLASVATRLPGNVQSKYNSTHTTHMHVADEHRVYNESEIEMEVADVKTYTIGTNDELEVVHMDVIEHFDRILTEPLNHEMRDYSPSIFDAEVEIVESSEIGEIEVEVVDHVPCTNGTNFELDTVNVNVIQSIDPGPAEPSSRQPYRHSIDIDRRHGCDKNKMFVPTSDQGPKKMCCVYCRKLFSKLVVHLEAVHKDEKDVKAFRSLAKGSPERRIIIDGIRIRGQFDWNKDADLNKGMFIPSRRPNANRPRKASGHEICPKCFRPIYGKYLRQHWNNCVDYRMKGERVVKALSKAIEKRLHVDACDDLCENIFPNMRDDECVNEVRYDWLLTVFGNDLCLNYSAHYQQDLIKRYLRAAGKLLLITDFASIFHVRNCNTIIAAIRIVSGFSIETKTFEHPSTAATSVTLINNISEVLLVESMKAENYEQETNVTRFSTVFRKEAKLKINKIVGVMKEKAHRERDENIPNTADVRRLADYLDSELEKCFIDLKREYSPENWEYLGRLVMASIIVFNRKRVGEVKNILVSDFHRRAIIAEQCDDETLDDSLENTKRLIKSRLKIRGKLDRGVPVLLKHTVDNCLELLLSHRSEAGVPVTNNFLFALPSRPKKIKIIDGYAAMRQFSTECGAAKPTSLRGTNLRKQFASVCATLGLTDNEVTNVANHMGHDDEIHRRIYRHNPLREEVVQMTGLLNVAQGRNLMIKGCANRNTKRTTKGTSKRTPTGPSKRTLTDSSKRTPACPTKRTTAATINIVRVATRKGQQRKASNESNSAKNQPKKSKLN